VNVVGSSGGAATLGETCSIVVLLDDVALVLKLLSSAETLSIVALLDDVALMVVEWLSFTKTRYVILLLGELVLMIKLPLNSGKLSKKGGCDSCVGRAEVNCRELFPALHGGRKSRLETL
jgi:hypothetical protein